MNKQFTSMTVLIISFLTIYFLIVVLLTGEVILPVGILILLFLLWFSVYKLRNKGLGARELLKKMYDDLEGTLEEIRERVAQDEARKRAAEERKEQVLWERERRRADGERRRASSPTRDLAFTKYTSMIENRVRASKQVRQEEL